MAWLELLKDRLRSLTGRGRVVEAFFQDVRHALRMLRRSPAFTLTAIITLALGIGANSAIFSVASGVLLRPLPYPAAERLAMVWMDNSRISLREDWHSYPDYADYRTQSTTFEDIAIFNGTSRTLTGDGEPERVLGAHSSANLFTCWACRPRAAASTPSTRTNPAPTTSSSCRTACGSAASAAATTRSARHWR